MTNDEHLERHLELCQRVFKRLLAEGNWPWEDSPKTDDVVDSESNNNGV